MPPGYFVIAMIVRLFTSPKSVVWTMTVTLHCPLAAPFGIVVVKTARPEPSVWIDFDMIGTLGAARENVAWAPATGWPFGSVRARNTCTVSGRREALIEVTDAVNFAVSSPEPLRTESVEVFALPAGSVDVRDSWLTPALIGMMSENAPLTAAAPLTDAPVVAFVSSRLLRAWVLPLTSTLLAFTTPPSFGEEILIAG